MLYFSWARTHRTSLVHSAHTTFWSGCNVPIMNRLLFPFTPLSGCIMDNRQTTLFFCALYDRRVVLLLKRSFECPIFVFFVDFILRVISGLSKQIVPKTVILYWSLVYRPMGFWWTNWSFWYYGLIREMELRTFFIAVGKTAFDSCVLVA